MVDNYLSLAGGLTACFRSACNIKLDEQVRLQLGAYVPGIGFPEQEPDHVDVMIEHEITDIPGLDDQDTYIKIKTPKGAGFPVDLYHLIYGIERRELMKRGLCSVHAACVGKDDRYTLIIGHSGAGKTTLAKNMVENHALKLFSGNKTIIRFDGDGSLTAVAGTRTMTSLDADLKRYAYEMAADDYAPETEVKINSVILVRINDGVEESQTLDALSSLHTLYPYFMDAVNADIIVNGKDVFDGMPGIETKNKLAANLIDVFRKISVQKYSGPMAFLEQKALSPFVGISPS